MNFPIDAKHSRLEDIVLIDSVLGRAGSKMTDSERDQIDADAETFIRTCQEAIKMLKIEGRSSNLNTSVLR